MCDDLDLTVAIRKLHRLQLEEGDLGAAYWLSISNLLKQAKEYRDRALTAEAALQGLTEIRARRRTHASYSSSPGIGALRRARALRQIENRKRDQ